MPRQRLASSDTTSNLSPAELYISQKSQMVFDTNDSPAGASSISSSTNASQHAERMDGWRSQEVNKLYKQEPYRYKYGAPPSSTFRRDDSQASSSSSYSNQKTDKSKKK
jgi:hypothetical protein